MSEMDVTYPTSSSAADDRPRGADGIPLAWEPGDVILDLYEVRPLTEQAPYAEGGMGRVNRVRHRQWQTDLAVKSVHPNRLQNPQSVDHFKGEAEEWVNRIGLHPHVVCCFYVRILGGLPRVFVEFVDGGSLADWIKRGQLYEGGPEQALRRMLDVAIQFAWGLHYVHELGMIHQDVKPPNVMMTADGVAKVTDFGLANARAKAFGEEQESPAGHTLLATWGGLTPAYCSPEQATIQAQRTAGTSLERLPKLTRRTDVWSWAVSVLEMFLGKIAWPSGSVAYIALKREAEDPGIPPMPNAVRELLQRCLQQQPDNRPHDLKDAADALQQIYQQVTGERYPREMPRAAEAVANTLNNRAVSLLDLGKPAESERLWDQALKADPHHAETVYNLGLIHWRSGRTDELELVRRLESIRDFNPTRVAVRLYLGHVHLERGDCAAAVQELQGVQGEAPGSGEVARLLVQAREGMPRSRRCLRTFLTSAVWGVSLSGDGRLALVCTPTRIKLWETSSGRCLHSLRGESGVAVDGRLAGVSLSGDGRLALSLCGDGAVRLWETSSGRCLHTYQDHTSRVTAVSLSGDGRLALSGYEDGAAKLWDTSSGHCLHTFLAGKSWVWVRAVSLSGDGRLALVSADTRIKLWETSSGRFLCNLQKGHRYSVDAVSLNGNGHLALTASSGEIKVWETSSGRCLHTFAGHPPGGDVTWVSLSGDGTLGLSAWSGDKTVKLWDTSSGRCLRTFQGHTDRVNSVSLSDDGRLALSGSDDESVKVWETSRTWAWAAPMLLSHWHSVDGVYQAQLEFPTKSGQGVNGYSIRSYSAGETYPSEE